jgi:5'-phosphate synthase pdxT subunit
MWGTRRCWSLEFQDCGWEIVGIPAYAMELRRVGHPGFVVALARPDARERLLETGRIPLVGVLALQGDYASHAERLRELGADVRLVRLPAELEGLDGLILPGGESTTFLKFLERDGFLDALEAFAAKTPAFGTCAGCILLAKDVSHPSQRSLGLLDVSVERNAYGRQLDSAVMTAPTSLPGGPLEMVFIRAPRIERLGPGVEKLAERDGAAVLVRQGHLLAATFHPELSSDARVHEYFLEMVRAGMGEAAG